MKRRQSLTTDTKAGVVQVLIEKILLSRYSLAPYFWNKSKCQSFNQEVYTLNKRLYQCLMVPYKKYGGKILETAIDGFTIQQKKKIAEAAKYNQKGAIIATLNKYCNLEVERIKRISKPKDTSPPEPIVFDPGEDKRSDKTKKKKNVWEFMNG